MPWNSKVHGVQIEVPSSSSKVFNETSSGKTVVNEDVPKHLNWKYHQLPQDEARPVTIKVEDSPTQTSPSSDAVVIANYTESDHHLALGIISVAVYIGVWIGSFLLSCGTVIFFLCGMYLPCAALCLITLICYIVPLKPSPWIRKLCRKSFSRYFKSTSIRFEHIPDPTRDRPTILCISPHGVFSMCWVQCYLTDELYHFRWCFSSLLNLAPFLRIMTRLTGHPSSIKKSSVINHMKSRTSIALIPGGWHEASIHNHLQDRIYIRKRQGFVKYALHYGYTITPSYAFGERMTYSNIQGCYKLRFWLNNFGISTIIPWGNTWCPLVPRPVALHTVIGKPIDLPHIPNPSSLDVETAHRMYMLAMYALFEKYKFKVYGRCATDCCLEFW